VQAVLALRWFRDRARIEALGRSRRVPRDGLPVCRRGVDVLSEQAPGLAEALERALAEGVPYVILDGKVFPGGICGTTSSAGAPRPFPDTSGLSASLPRAPLPRR